jgi:hypothetical protein
MRVFENRVLRRIFGPKRDEVTADWGKLHNVELHNLYSSSSIIRMITSRGMRWTDGCCSRNGDEEECIYDIGGKTRRKETTRKTKMLVAG